MSISGVGGAYNPLQWPSFSSTDTDGDDELSLQEITAAGQNLPSGGINGLSSDGLQQLFSAIDGDGDGKISRTEAKSAFDKLTNALQSTLLGAQEQSSGGPPSLSDMFAKADTDGSGGLSFDEFKAAAPPGLSGGSAASDDKLKALFSSLDTDGDGTISQDEMKAAHAHHHHHAHAPSSSDQTPNTDAIFGPDLFSTDPNAPGASDGSGTGSTSTSLPGDLNSLLLQAMDAYNVNPGQATSSDLVSQLVDVLKAAA